MFIEQLRGNYDVSELFQEECVLRPTKPTMDSGLFTDNVSTIVSVVRGLYVLRSRCCGCGPQHRSPEESPE